LHAVHTGFDLIAQKPASYWHEIIIGPSMRKTIGLFSAVSFIASKTEGQDGADTHLFLYCDAQAFRHFYLNQIASR
jgi:hypothetical protein